MYYPTIDFYTFRENLHIYILIFSILVVLTIFVYIKLVYPFWNIQPVYHPYDIWRSFNTKPFIIQPRFPIKTRFTDTTNVLTYNILDISNSFKKEIINLLQCHYLSSENAMYMFHVENFDATFAGHLYSPYISVFKEKYFTKRVQNLDGRNLDGQNLDGRNLDGRNLDGRNLDGRNLDGQNLDGRNLDGRNLDDEIIEYSVNSIGCITSRPIHIILKGENIDIYYIDFLCVDREHVKRKLTRTLLQTHDYNIRRKQLLDNIDTPIMGSIFKKEVELCVGIVPLIEFETPIYKISPHWLSSFINPRGLPPHFLLIEINDKNIDLVLVFLKEMSTKTITMFDVFGVSNISNLLELIKSRTLYIYCLKRMEQIYTIYFFRDSRVQYEGYGPQGALVTLIASIQNSNNLELFLHGFSISLQQIIKKQNAFCFCMIENLSHNNRIIDAIEELNVPPIMKNRSAYYFYNYVVPSRFSTNNRILLLM